FRAGHRCNSKTCLSRRKKASANKKYDIPMITDMVLADGDGDLLVSLEYVNYTSSLEFYCHICNDIYDKDLCHWLRGERCTCTVPNTKFTIGYIKQYMSGKFPHDILLSKQYVNTTTKLDIKCGECDEIYQTDFRSYKDNNRR